MPRRAWLPPDGAVVVGPVPPGGGGRIIVNASGAGKVAPGKEAPLGVYAMSKHAMVGLTRQLGVELAADGILVNCICGGIVDTECGT